jgi:hypothetical protein
MKRVVLFALPMLAVLTIVGLGVFLMRTQPAFIRPRLAAAREKLTHAIDVVAEDFEEEAGEDVE